jgi:hypothetical protein
MLAVNFNTTSTEAFYAGNTHVSIPCLRPSFKCPLNMSHIAVSQFQKYLIIKEFDDFDIFRIYGLVNCL